MIIMGLFLFKKMRTDSTSVKNCK